MSFYVSKCVPSQLKMRFVYFCGQILHLQKTKFHWHVQYWFHKMGQIFHQWLACVNAGQPVISPGASPARQAQNWLRPAHEMGSSPHTVRARKIYPPKSYLGLHPVYCVAANMDAVNHVSSRRAGQARSGQDRARSAWPHSASSKQLWVALNVQ